MAQLVLVVEPDFDLLGALASRLRSRGLEVAIADSIDSALDKARAAPPVAVIVASQISRRGELAERLAQDPRLASARVFTLFAQRPERELGADELDATDLDDVARRLHALRPRAAPVGEGGDLRGNLQQLGILDLLQLLCMNRRSGSLSVTTPLGAGEVRLANGEIVDAVYRRLEGEKALYRLLGETDGVFSFASGAAQALRRIVSSSRTLLLEGVRQIDECKRQRAALRGESDAFSALVPAQQATREAAQRVLEVLLSPRTLSELLDEVPLADSEVLDALAELLDLGQVRRIAAGATPVELADAERMAVLAALAKRAARPGFRGPVRIALAASQQRLAALTHAISRIADAVVASELVPSAPIPHALATLRLPEGAELAVFALPLVVAFAPLWALILPSCAAVAELEPTPDRALQVACANAGVPLVDAGQLLGAGDDSDPARVAALLRTLLERAAGG